LPWNGNSNASYDSLNKALSILGVDKQDNFAIYDLYALLVIFLHRTILKRLGLWRDYLADDELLLATNEEDKKNKDKQLSRIDTNIYRETAEENKQENGNENVNNVQTSSKITHSQKRINYFRSFLLKVSSSTIFNFFFR
jgi:hypothetical protein